MSRASLQVSLDVTRLDLSDLVDNQAATRADDLGSGQLNVWRNSIPATGEPITAVCDGIALRSAPLTGLSPDNVRCDGQVVAVEPAGRYDWAYLLCCSERRSTARAVYYFEDGSSCEQEFQVSDLWEGEPGHGEDLAHRSSQIHYPHHIQSRLGLTVWAQRAPIPRRQVLTHVRLPRGRAIHVFDIVLVSSWADLSDQRRHP